VRLVGAKRVSVRRIEQDKSLLMLMLSTSDCVYSVLRKTAPRQAKPPRHRKNGLDAASGNRSP
jgi:hypothetical protein